MQTSRCTLSLRVSVGFLFLAFTLSRPSLAGPTGEVPQPAAVVEKARALAQKGEALEAQGGWGETGSAEELRGVAAQLAAYREAHPEDIQAWILGARLGRLDYLSHAEFLRGATLQTDLAASDAEGAKNLAELQALLDRALALWIANAEAHFWKARLFGLRHTVIRDGSMESEPRDLQAAIREASEAVRLAPEALEYREALAMYFVLNQQETAAAGVMKEVSGGRHPYYVLLRGLLEIPVPQSAIALPEATEQLAQTEQMKGRLEDNSRLRLRVYIVPASAAEIEAFYRTRWPAFQWFSVSSEEAESGRVETKMELLRWISGGWQPVKIDKLEALGTGPSELESAAMVSVIEMRNLPAELLESTQGVRKLPKEARSLFSELVLVNYRKLDAPGLGEP